MWLLKITGAGRHGNCIFSDAKLILGAMCTLCIYCKRLHNEGACAYGELPMMRPHEGPKSDICWPVNRQLTVRQRGGNTPAQVSAPSIQSNFREARGGALCARPLFPPLVNHLSPPPQLAGRTDACCRFSEISP